MANRYSFQGRVALVTGGASGIGAAVASRLEEGGAEVHIFDLGNGDDVTDSSRVGSAVEKLPRLDVLVCAAASVATPCARRDERVAARPRVTWTASSTRTARRSRR